MSIMFFHFVVFFPYNTSMRLLSQFTPTSFPPHEVYTRALLLKISVYGTLSWLLLGRRLHTMRRSIKTLSIFYRKDNRRAVFWNTKILTWLAREYPRIAVSSRNSDALLVLGGDGTILEAVQRYPKKVRAVFGLNLGHTGFLASVREPRMFLPSLRAFLKGEYTTVKRMMVEVGVY